MGTFRFAYESSGKIKFDRSIHYVVLFVKVIISKSDGHAIFEMSSSKSKEFKMIYRDEYDQTHFDVMKSEFVDLTDEQLPKKLKPSSLEFACHEVPSLRRESGKDYFAACNEPFEERANCVDFFYFAAY